MDKIKDQRSAGIICWLTWLAATFLALTFIIYQSQAWVRAAKMLDAEVKTLDRTFPPGGLFLENDSTYWLTYANRIANGEDWRIRYTHADNTPYGREVHWSQSVSWMLVVLGKIRQAITGENIRTAIELAAVWMNPILFIALAAGLGFALFLRVGAVPAALFELYVVSIGNIGFTFQTLRPDHQGLHSLFGAFTLAGLVLGGAGWIKIPLPAEVKPGLAMARPLEVPELSTARKWFLFSGVAAGLGLWVSAAVQGMLLLLVFGAGVFLAVFAPSLGRNHSVAVRPELWRLWGWAGGFTALVFYLIEYFPSHMGMRLEVNNPWYSVVIVAMGEAVCQLLRARNQEKKGRALIKGILCTAVVVSLPLAIVFGPPDWHSMRDPQMFRLHKFIEEFQSFPRMVGPGYVWKFLHDFGILPLFLLLALAVANSPRLTLHEWAVIWISFALAYGILGLGYLQVRWIGLYAVMNVLLAAIVGVCAWRWISTGLTKPRQRWFSFLVPILFLVQPIYFMGTFYKYIQPVLAGTSVPKDMLFPLLAKRIAIQFREMAGPGAHVMASPSIAPALQYFADASTVTSLYWENKNGLHTALDFLTDVSFDKARGIAVERGLTHVLLLSESQLMASFYYIANGRLNEGQVQDSLVMKLLGSGLSVPPWITSDAQTEKISSNVYFYRGTAIEGQCRVYRINLDNPPSQEPPKAGN